MAESKELKSLLMKAKGESEKVGLKVNIPKTKIMASGPITSWQIDGETVTQFFFFFFFWGGERAPKWLHMLTVAMKLKDSWKKSYDLPRQDIKKQRHYFVNKGPSSQSYGFCISHVWMWELDYQESWAAKNWCFWTVVLEKTWEFLGQLGDPTSPS